MFEYNTNVCYEKLGTQYGSIRIKNIIFEPKEIEKVLPSIIINDENLMYMFAEDELTQHKRKRIYKRFIPNEKIDIEMSQYISDCLNSNVSFYSFLAEGILGLVFRDIYDYKLAKGIIDINSTLVDSKTGVDACMYDKKREVIVLGEAKFYESLHSGINKIIDNFIHNNIKNKLESLQITTENNFDSYNVVIKNLSLDEYDELTLDQFINQKIVFAGFVLHSDKGNNKYEEDFYSKYFLSVQKLVENIKNSLKLNEVKGNYEIIITHLPINSKKDLIVKIIEYSINELKRMNEINE